MASVYSTHSLIKEVNKIAPTTHVPVKKTLGVVGFNMDVYIQKIEPRIHTKSSTITPSTNSTSIQNKSFIKLII